MPAEQTKIHAAQRGEYSLTAILSFEGVTWNARRWSALCMLMLLPAVHRVAFRGISCTLKGARGDKVILDSIDGCCVPGTITAVLGPSGAGKSTLLDILAGRKNFGMQALAGHDFIIDELQTCSKSNNKDKYNNNALRTQWLPICTNGCAWYR